VGGGVQRLNRQRRTIANVGKQAPGFSSTVGSGQIHSPAPDVCIRVGVPKRAAQSNVGYRGNPPEAIYRFKVVPTLCATRFR
jgi:hypothetical protein